MNQYWGKYRGIVVNNKDPRHAGRLMVKVPTVFVKDPNDSSGGDSELWAMPCVPFAGPQVGFFALPPVDAGVWIEFERGNPDLPIWTGCFWADNTAPGEKDKPEIQVWKTKGITLKLDATSGGDGFSLELTSEVVSTPIRFSCSSDGIELSMGTQKIVVSDRSVAINDDALEVM